MVTLLHRLVKESIQFQMRLDTSALWINADPHQIEQVVMNLVINAKDTMPLGGSLTVETQAIFLDGEQIDLFSELRPGSSYAMITVTDSGVGMNADVKSRMFEPFFTTKSKGQGTGLGLATVFGVVAQSGGSSSFSDPRKVVADRWPFRSRALR
jgi:two-component system cell cycle sensor histidine kinase/response regulator CckA